MNAAFALAFCDAAGAAVRAEGCRARLLFFGFYLLAGVLANLGFAAVHPGRPGLVVGASGAVSGLMGAAARLIGGGGRPGPIFSRPVLGMGAAWLVINLLIGVFGGASCPAPAAPASPGRRTWPASWSASC